jgi:hypothetical protein
MVLNRESYLIKFSYILPSKYHMFTIYSSYNIIHFVMIYTSFDIRFPYLILLLLFIFDKL